MIGRNNRQDKYNNQIAAAADRRCSFSYYCEEYSDNYRHSMGVYCCFWYVRLRPPVIRRNHLVSLEYAYMLPSASITFLWCEFDLSIRREKQMRVGGERVLSSSVAMIHPTNGVYIENMEGKKTNFFLFLGRYNNMNHATSAHFAQGTTDGWTETTNEKWSPCF